MADGGGHPAGGAGQMLSTIDGVMLDIAAYLPTAKDKLSLLQVNRGWNDVLSAHAHDVLLFHNHLKEDFVEGVVLMRVAERHGVSRRKLYLAFRQRWSLPKEGGERVAFPWQRPGAQPNDDVSSLVFVARAGAEDDSDTCALMEWTQYDRGGHRLLRYHELESGYPVDPNRDWEDDDYSDEEYRGFQVPHNVRAMEILCENRDRGYHVEIDEFCREMKDTHHMTLHAIDVNNCLVMTLMDKDPLYRCDVDGAEVSTHAHGCDLPKLYGLPTSDYHNLSDNDYEEYHFNRYANAYLSGIEHLTLRGSMIMYADFWDEWIGGARFYTEGGIGLRISFDGRDVSKFVRNEDQSSSDSTIRQRPDVCSFLRALMKEKCHG